MTVELAFDDRGVDHSGTPLVLLHAFPLTRAMFDQVATELAQRRRVITPDLRGFGESPDPGPDEPALERMAGDVVALLDRLGVARCVLGGVSMGGYLTMTVLRRHPERLTGVVLIDTKGSADTDEARTNRERVSGAVLQHGSRALRPMLDTLLGPTSRTERPQVVATVTGWLDAGRPDAVAWAQRAMAVRPASFDTLSAAELPGYVVVGEEDELTPHDDALALSAAFTPHAPVHVIPRAGHLSPVENPDAVAGALRDVLRHLP